VTFLYTSLLQYAVALRGFQVAHCVPESPEGFWNMALEGTLDEEAQIGKEEQKFS
jgi:hypothetical protein